MDLFTPQLDFAVHKFERGEGNQKIVDEQRVRLSKKCRVLFDAFFRGEVINSDNSPVGDFRRRRQDLTDENGVHITLHSINGALRNWHMTETDKQFNQKFI